MLFLQGSKFYLGVTVIVREFFDILRNLPEFKTNNCLQTAQLKQQLRCAELSLLQRSVSELQSRDK